MEYANIGRNYHDSSKWQRLYGNRHFVMAMSMWVLSDSLTCLEVNSQEVN